MAALEDLRDIKQGEIMTGLQAFCRSYLGVVCFIAICRIINLGGI
jgi:hypothetical protein